MTPKTWLLLDANFLCWRAFHVFNGLKSGAVGTGVVYGFLRDVQGLMEAQATRHVAFCFDLGPLKRKELYPGYKAGRDKKFEEATDEEKEAVADMRRQRDLLRTRYLPEVGFRNVFAFEGYEADDVIGALVPATREKDEVVVVSADKDLWQLVDRQVTCWNPTTKKATNLNNFKAAWGIPPQKWAAVKAVAGCDTDNVVGLKGIGEKLAAKYFSGELVGNRANRIVEFMGTRQFRDNLKLVELPFAGCPEPDLVDDKVDQSAWRKLTTSLGMKSISGRPPGARGNGFALGVC